jgi:nascent polypeptide-associated complex subunit alpha
MFPGLNPKKMQEMMKQLGIAQQEIKANRVVIETSDREIIIENPSVIRVKMQGQENFQISGDVSEVTLQEDEEEKFEEDVQTIMEKTGCSEKKARDTLKKLNGDLTEAILQLS